MRTSNHVFFFCCCRCCCFCCRCWGAQNGVQHALTFPCARPERTQHNHDCLTCNTTKPKNYQLTIPLKLSLTARLSCVSAACDAHRSHTPARRTLPSARTGRRRPRSTERGTPTTTRHCVSDDAARINSACLPGSLLAWLPALLCCALPALPVRQLAGPHHNAFT